MTYAVLELPLVYGAGRKVQAEALFRKVCAGLELHRGQTFQGQDPKSVMQEVRKNCKKVEDDCEIFL